jgi:hypothetical protein
MILANVRHRLTRNDAQLALRLVARGDGASLEEAERRLRDDGIDALLDDPRLLAGLLSAHQGSNASFPLFAYVVVRHAMRNLGEDNRALADYVAAILVEFGAKGRAARVGEADDEVYESVVALAGDVNDPDATRSLLVRAHLGNYALWLSGLYPDYIETRRWRRGGPDLGYYEDMGRRGFQLAADHRLAERHGLAPLFAQVAERFPVLRMALNQVSDSLFFPNHHTPERLLRQVSDESRWRFSQ